MPRLTLRPIGVLLRSPWWAGVALLAGAVTFVFGIWLPNLGLIAGVTTDGSVTVADRLRFLWTSLGAATTAISPAQLALLGAIALLFGLNVALTLHTVLGRRRAATGAGVVGLLAGLLGVGCSACGLVLLPALIGTSATATLVSILPLGGAEFGIAGVLVLTAALLASARQADTAPHCDLRAGPGDPADGEIRGVTRSSEQT